MKARTSEVTTVLVTGAGSGIGAAAAQALARTDAIVICADKNLAAAQTVADPLGAQAIRLDVAQEASCAAAVQQVVTDHGRLDSLVHCAGIWEPALALDASEAAFDRVVGVNLTGTFLISAAAARVMISQGDGGAIVLIGSVNSIRAGAGQAVYAATKGAVLMLGQVFALDWAEYGIRVNVVGPGFTDTAMMASVLRGGSGKASLLERTPLGRVGTPAEIADAVCFLLSSQASYITGAFVPVDGGSLAG